MTGTVPVTAELDYSLSRDGSLISITLTSGPDALLGTAIVLNNEWTCLIGRLALNDTATIPLQRCASTRGQPFPPRDAIRVAQLVAAGPAVLTKTKTWQ